MAEQETVIPVVGMGATECLWTDRHPFTIIEVSPNGKRIVLQADLVKRLDRNGQSESQSYEYSPNPEGHTRVATLRKNGRWVTDGSGMRTGTPFALGFRREYHDPSF